MMLSYWLQHCDARWRSSSQEGNLIQPPEGAPVDKQRVYSRKCRSPPSSTIGVGVSAIAATTTTTTASRHHHHHPAAAVSTSVSTSVSVSVIVIIIIVIIIIMSESLLSMFLSKNKKETTWRPSARLPAFSMQNAKSL